MKNRQSAKLLLLIFTFSFSASLAGTIDKPINLKSPAGTETDTSVVLIWDKPEIYKDIKEYIICENGKPVGNSRVTNYTVGKLNPNTKYSFTIKSKSANGDLSIAGNKVNVTTKKKGLIYNILDYGAKGDSITINTAAIQKAINDCVPGGTVIIPSGIFLSGALFLKSNMTLYIQKGGVLKGSLNIADYLPMIPTRFEGWDTDCFSSLITAGKMDKSGKINVENLAIRGEGKIYGGGAILGKAMTEAKGRRSRCRLLCLMNGLNIDIQGLTIENSPCWTVHYTYCKNVTLHDLYITSNYNNSDGIDPDSSVDSYIFNCAFATGDDCIAIKSGKNPEGNIVGKPTENIWITNCNFISGHSLAIGSEMSGGVKNVMVRDCKLGNLYYGFQIKGTKDRGGYVENITVRDCDLQQIKIVSSVGYNNDGTSAPETPFYKNMEFSNLNMSNAKVEKPAIFLEGFDNVEHYTKNIRLKNILLPGKAKVFVRNCDNISFENVLQPINAPKAQYEIKSSTNITY